ncbi:PAS domain-containing sensor histidine kinase [Gemmatimonas phototrophica]|uniref:PAS domain-containing sensor histidine kinase n=1 Tax=Gemmatimonas phototrophica TaxID=1379270 RepID=UPI00047CA9AC|nr:PAS domain-containing protein [Gemmatimonas phototrophica]
MSATFVLPLLEQALSRLNDVVLITEAEPTERPGPRIVFVNAAFERMTGYTAQEVIGLTPRILQGPRTDPQVLRQLREALHAWQSLRVSLTNYHKNGTPFDVEFEVIPIPDAEGWFTHWVSIQRDITHRRLAEQVIRNASTLDELGAGICYELCEYTAAHVVLWRMRPRGQRHWHVLQAGVERLVDAQLLEADETCRVVPLPTSGELEVQLVLWHRTTPFGEAQCALAEAVAERAAPAADRLYAVLRQQRLANALRQSEKLEAIGRLSGGIAHDFNNLLTVVLGNVEYLQSIVPASDEVTGICNDITQASMRARTLVQRLLDFGRQRVPSVQPFAVDSVIASATALLERTLASPIHLTTAVEAPAPIVLGDPALLEQVLVNLVLNARDAMVSMVRPEPGEIRVVAVREVITQIGQDGYMAALPPGRYVAIDVMDEGPGMTDEVRERAFDPFFTTKPIGALGVGAGLGLSSAFGAVAMMGGTIRLENIEPHGLRVRVLVPSA